MLVCVSLSQPARAQVGFDASGGALGSLLEQLQGLESAGALRGLSGGRVTSALDRAREQSDDGRVQVRQTEVSAGGAGSTATRDGLSAQDRLFLDRYCHGELDGETARALEHTIDFSQLERDYCRRASMFLQQFAYDIFSAQPKEADLAIGAIPDSYVLGVGDELVLTFVGQNNRTLTAKVDREGRILIPGWQPVSVAGRTFGEVRREIEVRATVAELSTQVFVSLGSVRAVAVYVLGEVKEPGGIRLTSLSTVLDAISSAGGIKKTGSLRRIRVQRGGRDITIDLYELMRSGDGASQITLLDGDRIIVPTLGPTFAVAGSVLRAGIYEMPEGKRSLTVAEALDLAGGTLRPRGNRFLHFSFDENGRQRLLDHRNFAAQIADGDILNVALSQDVQIDSVFLEGHVRVPGRRSLATTTTVRGLIGDVSIFKPDPYLLFGALETTDPNTRARRLFPLNLKSIIDGKEDYALREGDRLIVLGGDDIRYLSTTDVQEIITRRARSDRRRSAGPQGSDDSAGTSTDQNAQGSTVSNVQQLGLSQLLGQQSASNQTQDGAKNALSSAEEAAKQAAADSLAKTCSGLKRLAGVLSVSAVARYANAVRSLEEDTQLVQLTAQDCPDVYDRFGDLLPLAMEHLVAMHGAVRRPGAYPVAGSVPVTALIAAAGGLTREVDLTKVELFRATPDSVQGVADTSRGLVNLASTNAEDVTVGAGDIVRFNEVFIDRDSGPVLLAGEFVRPGLYEIRRGERLSEVVARAGGLTEQAYPYGAVFTRESVKRLQQIGFQRAARELSSAIAVAAVQRGVDASALLQYQRFAQQLDSVEALGRVVIEADPTVLQVRPELDGVLQPGDRVYMPKRPNFVIVIGDVLNPGAMQFISGTNADRYIRQAGGFQRSADEDRIFVVYPNGSAEPIGVSAWNFSPVQIPPGSTIVVPKDPAPFDLLTLLREGSSVVSQLAVTAASLAVISRD